MKLAFDHHYSTTIAVKLRELGHDAVAAIERDWHKKDDESLLHICHGDQRALVTNNVGDFMQIVRRWAAEGRSHHGLILTSDASMPRSRNTIGRYVAALREILESNAPDAAFVDRIHWL